MNLIDFEVVEILGPPVFNGYSWEVPIIAESWGGKEETKVTFPTKKAAETMKVGFVYLA